MTVEEIKTMCNNVLNASKQMDDDYRVLKGKEENNDKELADRFNSFLDELTENYLESGIALMNKASELLREYKNEYGWCCVKGLCIDSKFIYSEEVMHGKLICGFYKWTKDKVGIVFAKDRGEKDSTIQVWQYDGGLSPFYINTAYKDDCKSSWSRSGDHFTVFDTLKKAAKESFYMNNKDMLVNDLETIMSCGEDMIQRLIAKMSQVILDLSAERNKEVTDRL